jgi:anthranilate/para-aminobenzoate synthase component I
MYTQTARLPYADALTQYRQLKNGVPSCLFESASAVDKSSRMSVIGLQPSLELTGKDDYLKVSLLDERAQPFMDFLRAEFGSFISHDKGRHVEFVIPKLPFEGSEDDRLDRQNIVQPLRRLLAHFQTKEKNFMGFYGGLSYRFVYQFEDIEHDKPCEEPDFHLFLFDNILLYNHLTQDLTLYVTRHTDAAAKAALAAILVKMETALANPTPAGSCQIGKISAVPDDETFKNHVERGIRLCFEGELLEIVLSRKLTARAEGDLLRLYEVYKKINPSPYLFFFDFGNETLLGASPELMLRYENGRATLRPISGSVRRSDNPIEDHHLMMELLNSPKENSELDMLIDLGRNDLARICKPGIEIDHYRIIEKYSHVTHTVAQVSGTLEERYSGFDALIASLNAGTLTGAPKVAAMQYIEQIERHTRGYYGGSIGWLLFNGEVNTAITIRTAHIRDNQLSFCAGATLLYESNPDSELKETKIKAGAFLAAVEAVNAL